MSYILISLLIQAIFVLRTLHYTHMFQLNSYRPERQMRWLKANVGEYLISTFPLLVALIIPAFYSLTKPIIIAVAEIVVLFIGLMLNIPGKAKKPLVYTARVKRFLAVNFGTFILLFALCILIAIKASKNAGIIAFGIFILLSMSPLRIIICSYLISPLEKAICNHYAKDAKRIIDSHKNLTVIGVTGSYGKTSVKHMLATLLEAKYNVLMTPGSFNTPMGVTKTIRESLRGTHDIFICEMGAKQVGDIKEICDLVTPTHGVITSVGSQHLETFKSLDNIKKTKFELAEALPANGKLFLNGEDENIAAYNKNENAITYGLSDKCTYFAKDISVSSKGTSFTVTHGSETVAFTTSVIGEHNVVNVVGAIAVACEMGIELSKLPPYVRKLAGIEHRLQLIQRGDMTIIDDAYNSNPAGSAYAVNALNLFEGCKIIITPGMIELGKLQYEENKKFGMHIADTCDYVVLVGKKITQPIYDGLKEKGYPEDKIYITETLDDGAAHAFAYDDGRKKVVLFENDLPDNF